MRKTFKSFLLISLVVLSGLLLVSCGGKGDSKAMKAAKEELTIAKILKDNTSKDEVKTDLDLVATAGEATVTWSTDKAAVVSITGKVTRTAEDELVKLTANLKIDKETSIKEFLVTVVKTDGGVNPNPGETVLSHSFDFSALGEETAYVKESTTFNVSNMVDNKSVEFSRYYTNISTEKNSANKGLVLAIRGKDSFPSPYVQTKFAVKGLQKIDLVLFGWANDVSFNFGFLEKFVVETSTDGATWSVAKDITSELSSTGVSEKYEISLTLPNAGNYFVRLQMIAKTGLEASDYSLRYILKEMKLYGSEAGTPSTPDTDAKIVADDAQALTLPTSLSVNTILQLVKSTNKGSSILWTVKSGDAGLINLETGAVTIPENEVTLVLNARVTKGTEVKDREFSIILKKGTTPTPNPGDGAAGTETFDNAEIGASYVDGSFKGVNGVTWKYTQSRDEGDYGIDGNGIMLRGENNGVFSSLEAEISGGITNFTFQYRKAFTGGAERTYAVDIIVGSEVKTFTFGFTTGSTAEDTVYNFILAEQAGFADLVLTGNVKIRIYAVGKKGNKQIVIDNISWAK
ncbi:immunoglobulin-like domain-containing protein [Haploplasma axanthum]|uniref:Atrophied bacterial Ig domain-containing protein n=1 Tax=Haploplasma axanthum TaxID=29552 RepID=A0A449BC92_HAPAX|nr:immunoglobulin-like domain-containing protein [Haploplasma axanthum]VEU80056.1 Uncharacterised protein [Haploplasma axanthum]